MAGGGCGACNSVAERDAQIRREIGRIADGKAVPKGGAALFHQQDTKNFVVDVPFDERGCARQNFVKIEGSVHFLADFGKGREYLGRHFAARLSEFEFCR